MNIKKVVLGVSLVVLAIFLLINLITFGSFLGFFLIFPFTEGEVAKLGINLYLAEAVSIFISLALWFIIFNLFLSWRDAKKRKIGFILLAMIFVFRALSMFLFSSGGEALSSGLFWIILFIALAIVIVGLFALFFSKRPYDPLSKNRPTY